MLYQLVILLIARWKQSSIRLPIVGARGHKYGDSLDDKTNLEEGYSKVISCSVYRATAWLLYWSVFLTVVYSIAINHTVSGPEKGNLSLCQNDILMSSTHFPIMLFTQDQSRYR
jgi:hypothetical protein